MTTSELIRLVAAGILIAGFFAWRLGIKEQWEAKKKKKKIGDLKKERQGMLDEARRKAMVERDAQKRRTSQILRAQAGELEQKVAQVAKEEVWYLEGGVTARGSTVLLLHGFPGAKEDWTATGKLLVEAGFHVVAPDLPGFGQNEKDPEKSYDVTTQAKRIRAFVQTLGVAPVHLVGASLGGSIAAAYAYGAAADVLGLVLIEPLGVKAPEESELDRWLAQDRNPMVIAATTAYDNLLGFLHAAPPDLPPSLKQHHAEQIVQNRELYLKMWAQVRGGDKAYLVDMLLPEIKKKALIVQGSASKVVHPVTAEILVRRMADAKSVVLEGCGHVAAIERPEETAKAIVEFLREIPAPPTAG